MSRHFSRNLAALAFLATLSLVPTLTQAADTFKRILAGRTVRVCIWPDYFGITYRHPHTGALSGLDIDMSAALANDLRLQLTYVDSSFASLTNDLLSGRCDVAMFAVGKLPQRMEQLRFTRAYLESDIYGIVAKTSSVVRGWDDIDKPGVQVGVQAGTFMEPVMRERLRHAQMVLIRPPATRERELQAGRIDVFMTDFPYSHGLMENAPWAHRIVAAKPFFVLPYAYAVRPGDDEWLEQLDQFVARVQADGRLRRAALQHGLATILAPGARP